MQQKTIPNDATHGNTYNSSILKPTGASHSHLHKPNEKKEKGTSLRASSLFATAPELVPRACTCRRPARRPARSDGVVEKRRRAPSRQRSIPSAQFRGRGLLASHPARPSLSWTATGPRMRRLVAPKPTREPKSSARQKKAGQASPEEEEEGGVHTREREPAHVRLFYTPRMQIFGSQRPVGGATLARWSEEKGA